MPQNMMQQMQIMQQKADKLQRELAGMTVTGKSEKGFIEVDVTGQTKFKKIRINPALIDPTNPNGVSKDLINRIEKEVASAVLKATSEAAKIAKQKMEAITQGMMGMGSAPAPPPQPKPTETVETKKSDDFGTFGGFEFGKFLG